MSPYALLMTMRHVPVRSLHFLRDYFHVLHWAIAGELPYIPLCSAYFMIVAFGRCPWPVPFVLAGLHCIMGIKWF